MKISSLIMSLGAVMLLQAPAYAAESYTINGSTTVLPVMQKVSEAFMGMNPNVSLVISGGGSGNGIKALNEGLCDVAMSSRPMKSSEKELAKSKNINPTEITIAVDALVPIVHPSNQIANLTDAQLRDIYKGVIKNWKEVGGADAKIVIISRDTSSGTYECWEEFIMKKEKVSPAALLQASNGAVVQAVSKNKNAIGYIGFGYVDASTKTLDVNGIKASPATALSREWPISRDLYLYTNGAPKGTLKDLIDFSLDAQKGQKLVQEVGYIPLSK